VYFIPHIIIVAMCVFGEVFGGKKKTTSSEKKME
jgi:hypothetical protein